MAVYMQVVCAVRGHVLMPLPKKQQPSHTLE
jgi:hypothetical protein